MLQDDSHLFGILLAQAVRDAHAGRASSKRHIKMMIARQAILARINQDIAHNTAQRILNQQIVSDMIS